MEKQKTKKKNFRGGFPECLCCGTRERGIFFKKNKFLCRVPELRHSAKKFVFLKPSLPSAAAQALGEATSENSFFFVFSFSM